MSTFDQLVDSTILYLSGFTTRQDQATYLTQPIDADDLTIQVNDANAVSRGLVEIGNEILQVDVIDRNSQSITCPPYGRGFRGTTAASHVAGTRVCSAPQFPRHAVAQALNDTISAVYPDLFAIYDEYITSQAALINYNLTNQNVRHVLKVSFDTVGPSEEWLPSRRYELKPYAQGGAQISVYDQPVPGKQVHVRTAGPPTQLTWGQNFSASGLPASAEDVIRFGAAYRMVPYVEVPMLSGLSSSADFAANMRPVGAAERLGKYILGMYQMRLEEVRRQQQAENPIRAHYER